MTQPSSDALRIMAMRAAYDSVDEITAVVEAFREGGNVGRALLALDERWPELTRPPWRRTTTPDEGQ